MNEDENRVTVTIDGQTFTFRGEPAERVLAMSRLVDEKVQAARQRNPRLTGANLLTLVAMELAGEVVDLRHQHQQLATMLDDEWRRRTARPTGPR